jgi:hypothetical protein
MHDKLSDYKDDETITIQPLKAFSVIKTSLQIIMELRGEQRIAPFKPPAKA